MNDDKFNFLEINIELKLFFQDPFPFINILKIYKF